MRPGVLILFLIMMVSGNAQKINVFAAVDKIVLQMPDSSTHSAQAIANYINKNFTSAADKSRAAFIWIAQNIQYDIHNMFAINFYKNKDEVIEEALKNRKGICMHYAELYNAIANKSNIPTYVVDGYTKQAGFVDYVPHNWCASFIDTAWYLFDPTWGSGYVNNAKFVKFIDNKYFMAKPDSLIRNHISFDPLFQFLNYPVTNQEFYEGKTKKNTSKTYFNYKDTLAFYNQQTNVEQLISSSSRIEKNGVKNALVYDMLEHQKREIEYINNKTTVDQYNASVNTYNEGVALLNEFINYRNKQFNPKKTDDEIKQMADTAGIVLNRAKQQLKLIKNPDENILAGAKQLNKSIDEALYNLDEQKAFLDKYFTTGKLFRKSLFYHYSWMGIPIK